MQLRRFTAESTPAALGAVRSALGDDAIILANRKIGDQVEIIATGQMEDIQSLAEISIDAPGAQRRTRKERADGDSDRGSDRLSRAERNSVDTGTETDNTVMPALSTEQTETEKTLEFAGVENNSAKARSTRSLFGSYTDKPLADSEDDLQQRNEQSEYRLAEPRIDTSKLTDTRSRNARPASQRFSDIDEEYTSAGAPGIASELHESIARHNQQLTAIIEQQNTMINQFFKGLEVNLWGNTSPHRRLHLQRLLGLGLGSELAIQLVERADPNMPVDDALRQSFSLLKSTLPIGVDKTFSVPGVTIVSGPPGAGKTTVLMKIATQHVKQHGSDSIVILCADTRRIGAFEELQAYGRLLGVPTVHAHDGVELESLLDAFTHKKLVLIDHTLSMAEDAVEIPKHLLGSKHADTVRQLFVLSATSQSSTVDDVISKHCSSRSVHCVLTHLDACARLGEVFNAIIRHHLPIAYWSDSASIQKPLQKADASVLIATAVAMSRRQTPTADDECLLRLIQPSDHLMTKPIDTNKKFEVMS